MLIIQYAGFDEFKYRPVDGAGTSEAQESGGAPMILAVHQQSMSKQPPPTRDKHPKLWASSTRAYSTPIPPPIPVQTLPAIPAETGHPLHSKPYHPFQSKVGQPFQSKPAM